MKKPKNLTDLFAAEKVLPEEWDFKGLDEAVFKQFNFRLKIDKTVVDALTKSGLSRLISEEVLKRYRERESLISDEECRELERIVMLQTVDNLWKDHLLNMDHLKEGIGLRGYAQQDPLLIYKKEGFEMFNEMIFKG